MARIVISGSRELLDGEGGEVGGRVGRIEDLAVEEGLAAAARAALVVIYGFLFWMGGMGAGDVKLCAAIGAWIGPGQLFLALVITGMVGGVMVLCWAAFGGFLKELFTGASNLAFGWKERGGLRDPELVISNPLRRKMPYAPAIAIGTLISFFAR